MNDIISVERNGSVATVTIDRGEKRNALNQEMVLSLTRIAEEFQNDTSTTCVVLTGNAKEFSAGIDLGDPARWADRKSVGKGKRGSVGVELGGGGIIKKEK